MIELTDTLNYILESLYFPLRAISITSEKTRYQYRLVVQEFSRFLGHPATKFDLSHDNAVMWMGWMLRGEDRPGEMPLAAITVKERATRLGTFWEWMARRKMIDVFPTFDKPRVPQPNPWALNADQLRELYASAGRERGKICGIPAWLWCQSYLLFVLNSGERKTAALSVRCEWIDLASGICCVPPGVRKGGVKPGTYALWPKTKAIVARCVAVDPARDLVWPWEKCEGSYYTMYDRILRDAGLPVNRHSKTQALRVSLGTWVKVFGGDPTETLGHSDTGTFMKHYNDRRYTAEAPPDLSERFQIDV